MYSDNDYRNYLEHSNKGNTWKNHKYLYKTAEGRYVYPEDVNTGSKRSFGGSGRKFDTVKETLSGRSLADKATRKRKTSKYMKQVLNNATEAAKKKAHGGGQSTVRTTKKFKYTYGQMVNPNDYGITRLDTVKTTFGGSGRGLKKSSSRLVNALSKINSVKGDPAGAAKSAATSKITKSLVDAYIKGSKKKRVLTNTSASKRKKAKNRKLASQAIGLLTGSSLVSKAAMGYKQTKYSSGTKAQSFRTASANTKTRKS